ncbi:MAG: PAS domain S-box protein, partial [Blastocatellia bacterium]
MKVVINGADPYPHPPELPGRSLFFGYPATSAILDKVYGQQGYAVGSIESLAASTRSLGNSFEQFLAVIIDQQLPWAIDLCFAVKSTGQIPVIILCRDGNAAAAEQWVEAGADEIIQWPTSTALVRKRVQTLVELADARRSFNDAAQKLGQLEAEQTEFLDNSIDILYRLDLSGNLTSISKAVERVTGYHREELLSNGLSQLVAPEYEGTMQRMLDAKVAGEPSSSYEIEIIARDGCRKTLEINSRLVRRDGDPVGIQGIARDVTARKGTETAPRLSEYRYRDLVDHTRDWICSHDLEGRLLFINKGAAEMLGYEPEELAGICLRDLIQPRYHQDFDAYLERIKTQRSDRGFLTLIARDGEPR